MKVMLQSYIKRDDRWIDGLTENRSVEWAVNYSTWLEKFHKGKTRLVYEQADVEIQKQDDMFFDL